MAHHTAGVGGPRKTSLATLAADQAQAPELNTTSLGELALTDEQVLALQLCWKAFLDRAGSIEVAGRAIFNSLFQSAPELPMLFGTHRAPHVERFMSAMQAMIDALAERADLKVIVESLGFRHVSVDVNIPRVRLFRDCVVDLVEAALDEAFTEEARVALNALMNYLGGALLFIKISYGDRLRIIAESWKHASERARLQEAANATSGGASSSTASPGQALLHADSADYSGGSSSQELNGGYKANGSPQAKASKEPTARSGKDVHLETSSSGEYHEGHPSPNGNGMSPGGTVGNGRGPQAMPTTFGDMFQINAAVMGLRKNAMVWMGDVLEAFDALVVNASSYDRLREECDVLSLRLSRHPAGTVNLPQFRACMLAALRSLLPKQWTTSHEDAWSWMWESVAQMLMKNLGNPARYEATLTAFFEQMDEDTRYEIRRDVYDTFFAIAPKGQDYFTQSNTRLHFISDRVLSMSLELYHSPKKQVSEICSLGLRHVGYGVPTSMFPPFVTACVQVVQARVDDPVTIEAFRWSLNLISKILMRTITEGSTVVMKAINNNSERQLKKAIDSAPRKSRTTWLLNVQVGDQHISPLYWAIESGSLKVAEVILRDIMTIRADRARYYYGVDELWERHPNIVKKMNDSAPMLLQVLLDGLVWRSHRTKDGMRRVNYYIKHVLVQRDGTFSDALECISASGDPTLVSHPTVALLADTLWSGVVLRQFISSRMWNILSLMMFILSQEVLPTYDDEEPSQAYGWSIFAMRTFTYTIGMGRLAMFHVSRIWLWCRKTMRRIIREIDTDGNGNIEWEEMIEALSKFKDTVREEIHKAFKALREDDGPGNVNEAKKAIANREKNIYTMISFALMALLALMLTHEPVYWCAGAEDWPTQYCNITGNATVPSDLRYRYSIFGMAAMAVHWLILIDLAVFSTEISAFLLVCGHVLGEVKQFLIAVCFLLLTFSTTISIHCRHCDDALHDFDQVQDAMVTLFAISVGFYQSGSDRMELDWIVFACATTFTTASVILLLNLLIAQLGASYEYIYKDMLGFARLNRASLIVDAMESCSAARWKIFVESLNLDTRLEFDEGDLGLSGGIATWEPAGLHRLTRESIKRFGGIASGDMPWPEEKTAEDDEADRLDRLERLVQKVLRRTSAMGAAVSGSGLGAADQWSDQSSVISGH